MYDKSNSSTIHGKWNLVTEYSQELYLYLHEY